MLCSKQIRVKEVQKRKEEKGKQKYMKRPPSIEFWKDRITMPFQNQN
jgi:hypothetical protein